MQNDCQALLQLGSEGGTVVKPPAVAAKEAFTIILNYTVLIIELPCLDIEDLSQQPSESCVLKNAS